MSCLETLWHSDMIRHQGRSKKRHDALICRLGRWQRVLVPPLGASAHLVAAGAVSAPRTRSKMSPLISQKHPWTEMAKWPTKAVIVLADKYAGLPASIGAQSYSKRRTVDLDEVSHPFLKNAQIPFIQSTSLTSPSGSMTSSHIKPLTKSTKGRLPDLSPADQPLMPSTK